MNIQSYLDKMIEIQDNILEFINDDENNDEMFQQLMKVLKNYNIFDDSNLLKLLLHMILNITNNHHHNSTFFFKIERILQLFKNDILKYFTNFEIFTIFKSNKRLLLYFIENEIVTFDEYIVSKITSRKYVKNLYPQYFAPEIKPFINNEFIEKCNSYFTFDNEWIDQIKKESSEDFNEKRKIGENENYICELIRKDDIIEFISFVNRTNYSLNSNIEPSIYETNDFLLEMEEISLIEYASFFGSIQILKYMQLNNIELKRSLWIYSIHGKNSEIIHLLEENHIEPNYYDPYKEITIESIKCHHNEIANYIINNHMANDDIKYTAELFITSLKYYNFEFINEEFINESSFPLLCKYDYYFLVDFLMNNNNKIDINNYIINEEEAKQKKKELIQIRNKIYFDLFLNLIGELILFSIFGFLIYKKYSLIAILMFAILIGIGNGSEGTFLFIVLLLVCKWKWCAITLDVIIGFLLLRYLTKIKFGIASKFACFVYPIIEFVMNAILIVLDACEQSQNNRIRYKNEKKIKFHEILDFAENLFKVRPRWLENTKIKIEIATNEIDVQLNDLEQLRNASVFSPLYNAVRKGNIEIIKLLLENDNIDVNINVLRNKYIYDAKTVLHIAVIKCYAEIIEVLLKHKNINVNKKDSQNERPIDYARSNSIKQLFEYY